MGFWLDSCSEYLANIDKKKSQLEAIQRISNARACAEQRGSQGLK